MSAGWDASSQAWITEQGEEGDYGRRYVLDAPMIARLQLRPYTTALDVGCGEGRFCRMMQRYGIRTVGIDPTEALIAQARLRDPAGDYRVTRAEALNVAPCTFDLVVSYLSLIDIPDLAIAIDRMVAALRPGGTLLIANLNSFNTAGMPDGWTLDAEGEPRFCIDHYLEERAIWVGWRGIRIQNWHRPLSAYLALLLGHGLELRHFAEPAPHGGDPAKADRYRRVPYFHIMEWAKPGV
ncbi:class I SAM-dependent methyltransferase [Salinarimonas soli]|uniref:Class I SAM-dependent methyltransferase n=2 Tax=Salinarimonas soli TaxID=1638099 RepID=A0A5B2VAP6_9HYPH|nr:class I SAM-dependent methyltransferase [Salinarimonas soli]